MWFYDLRETFPRRARIITYAHNFIQIERSARWAVVNLCFLQVEPDQRTLEFAPITWKTVRRESCFTCLLEGKLIA